MCIFSHTDYEQHYEKIIIIIVSSNLLVGKPPFILKPCIVYRFPR